MIVGTAGHIDHGKSALVTALTGRTVDRLAEEKRRGITIELNFAPLELDGLPPVGIVDVPGHEDFVRTMVAGASGIDLVLLVIDLVEGARPQTEEHLAVLEQLRIPRGIPVFTKRDLVEAEWADLVVADVMARLAGSPVAFAPAAVVSARTGLGIDELRSRLRDTLRSLPGAPEDDTFRMPVDRVFSLAGVGTVVTGTAWSGRIAVGDTVRVLPGEARARVRSIETYGHRRDSAGAGTRIALGVTGVDRHQVDRGHWVVDRLIPWTATMTFDAAIELLPSAPRALTPRTRVRVHLGTGELLARVHPRGTIAPGGKGLVRVRLETPALVRGGDRTVLRSYSPVTTIGGGLVLDPDPPRGAAWPAGLDAAEPAARLAALVERRRRGLAHDRISQTAGTAPGLVRHLVEQAPGVVDLAGTLMARPAIEARAERVLAVLAAHHASAPAEPGLSLEIVRRAAGLAPAGADALLDDLGARGLIRQTEATVALPDFTPLVEAGEDRLEWLVARVREAGLEPPSFPELAGELGLGNIMPLIRRATESGAVVAVERDRCFSPDALERFRAALEATGVAGPISPAALRQRIDLSRKFMIPLLEWADRQGITRREGDTRVLVRSGMV